MSDAANPSEVTRLVRATRTDRAAAEELLALVYAQLRSIARQRMSAERRDHTLQATALVHEAYLRLLGDVDVEWQDRGQFYAAAAEAMRRILVEHARARGRVKRGGEARRVPSSVLELAESSDSAEILMLDDAICRLEEEDPQAARVVRLRFFAGLSVDETAAALGVSSSSVDRDWAYARARLYRLMAD